LLILSEIAGVPMPEGLWSFLRDQLAQVRWNDPAVYLGTGQMLFGRGTVAYFLPLLIVLLLLPRRHLRAGIILTGLVFVGYVFGGAYLFLWILTCLAFYWISEWFAIEVKRTDVWRGGPILLAIGVIAGHFLLANYLKNLHLPQAGSFWLTTNARWLYPLGARGWAFEPAWFSDSRQLFSILFERTHDVGAAYITMRMVHYFSEIKRGGIKPERRSLFNFCAYLCYAPTLIQGPIERYNEFNDQIDTCYQRRSPRDMLAGVGRICLGAAKTFATFAWLGPVLWNLKVFHPDFYAHPEQVRSYGWLFFGVHLQVLAKNSQP
jgi:D-alanyl-lipoteichoic acid acyltransferase DltB (MBOAT superfamily)